MYNTFPLKLFNRVNSLEKSVPQLFMHFHRSTNYLICLLVLHFINSALICACPVGPEDRTGVICGSCIVLPSSLFQPSHFPNFSILFPLSFAFWLLPSACPVKFAIATAERSLPRRSGRSYWGVFNRGPSLLTPSPSIPFLCPHVITPFYILTIGPYLWHHRGKNPGPASGP